MVFVQSSHNIVDFKNGPLRRSVFSNGAVSLFHQMKGMNSAVVRLHVLAGSSFEEKKEYGLAHLLEHLLFKEGGVNHLVKELELRGAEINAYTDREEICFELDCSADRLEEFLPLFLHLVTNLNFTIDEFEKEKSVVLQELKDEEDDHEAIMHDYLLAKEFPPHIGHPIGGTLSSVAKLTRNQVQSYFEKYFIPPHMVLAVASGKSCRNLEKIFLTAISKWSIKSRPLRKKKTPKWSHNPHFQRKLKRRMENALLFYSFDSVTHSSKKYYDFILLDDILFEGMSSLFFKRLREDTGLIYALGSSLNSFDDCASYTWIFNCQAQTLKHVKKEVNQLWSDFCQQLVSKEYLDLIKARIRQGMLMAMDSIQERCEFIASCEIYREKNFDFDRPMKLLDKVGLSSLQSTIKIMADSGPTVLEILPENK